MKLIKCNNCGDVVRLVHVKWRKCACGKSGGQYNKDLITATVGGDCEVIGLRNDFFKEKPFSKKRIKDNKDKIIQGEYKGDNQIHRIKSANGPRLKMDFEDNKNGTHNIIFKDKRSYKINIKGNKTPKKLEEIPSNEKPSFKKESMNFNNTVLEILTEAKGGRCTKVTKQMPSSRSDKKYMRCARVDGKLKRVHYGDPNLRIKKSNPKKRKSFRARHKCSTAKPGTAKYFSCKNW